MVYINTLFLVVLIGYSIFAPSFAFVLGAMMRVSDEDWDE